MMFHLVVEKSLNIFLELSTAFCSRQAWVILYDIGQTMVHLKFVLNCSGCSCWRIGVLVRSYLKQLQYLDCPCAGTVCFAFGRCSETSIVSVTKALYSEITIKTDRKARTKSLVPLQWSIALWGIRYVITFILYRCWLIDRLTVTNRCPP